MREFSMNEVCEKEIARGIFTFAGKRESRAGSKNRAEGEFRTELFCLVT